MAKTRQIKRDIAARRIADLEARCDQLAYLESIWRLAVDNVDQGAWDYNAVGDKRFFSDGWKRIRGMEADAQPYPSFSEWFERVHPDDQAFVATRVEAHNSGEERNWEFAYRELTVDNRWVWILSRGRSVAWDEQGRPTRLLGTDIDITEVKERELQQAASEKRTYDVHVASLRSANTEAEEARQTAVRLANSDQLSELPNRRYFLQVVQDLIQTRKQVFGVLILDVDDFKHINDRHGHAAGDFVIHQTARRLAEQFSSVHLVARLGGDEFGLLLCLPETGALETIQAFASQVCDVMRSPIIFDGVPLTRGCSVGAALFPRDDKTVSGLLKCADLALYRAKTLGKGQCAIFDSSLAWQASQQALIESQMRDAIKHNTIIPYYQPVLDSRCGRIVALEALARWECPKLGLVLPHVFLPVAEKLGLLDSLTACVFEQADCFVTSLPEDVCLSFNLNAAEVCDMATPLRIASLLKQGKLSAQRILIEITEQALVRNIFVARQVIAALRGMGLKVYLDDFGAGYSGLCYLKDLQVDGLKFDKSLAQTVTSNPATRVIMQSMFDLARNLGLETIVEGIETAEALEIIVPMGARLAQGYHFARPLTAEKALFLFEEKPVAVPRRHRS